MQLEQKRIDQSAYIVKSSFGPGAFGARHANLPGRGNDADEERQENDRRGRNADLVSLNELRGSIREGGLARDNR